MSLLDWLIEHADEECDHRRRPVAWQVTSPGFFESGGIGFCGVACDECVNRLADLVRRFHGAVVVTDYGPLLP
jgi:hypothetical protein